MNNKYLDSMFERKERENKKRREKNKKFLYYLIYLFIISFLGGYITLGYIFLNTGVIGTRLVIFFAGGLSCMFGYAVRLFEERRSKK